MPEAQKEQQPEVRAASKENLISEVYTGQAEISYKKSGYVPESFDEPYNPDDLYQKKGDYTIYQEMRLDDQVAICLNLKKDLVLGSGYTLSPESDDQMEMCKELESLLEDGMEMPFTEKLKEVLDAYDIGFSLTEKVFQLTAENKLQLSKLLTRHPNSWLIYQDDKGNITKFEQQIHNGRLEVNPKALIHYVNNGKYQNPYGESDLRPAYAAYFSKRQIIRYFGIFLESQAKAIPVGRYDTNAPAGTADTMLEILRNFQAKTALVLPKQLEVEFLEAKSNGEAYHKAINIFNMFIGRALFIPDLMGMTGGETSGGAYSLGKEQMNIFFMHINRRRSILEKIVQQHILKPLVLWNYGDVPIPKFKFNPLDDTKAVELAKTWLDLIKAKVVKPTEEEVQHFRKLVQFPISEEVELYEEQGQKADQVEHGQMEDEELDDEAKAEEKDTENGEDEKTKGEFAAKVYDYPAGDYHKKVDFKAIENKLNDYDKSIKDETAPIIKKMFADFYEQLQRKNPISKGSIDIVDNLSLKYKGELKRALKNSFAAIYKDGQVQAAQELNKSDFALPTTSDEFLDILEQETFKWIGDYEYGIKKKTKEQLVAAIKDGKPLSSVIDVLDNEGKKLSEVSLERFARTKHTEVLNRGRHEYFQNSGVISGYQYSAILDDRTSDICRGLHGKKFKVGTEPIPPMHFNCRSVLIPITKYEEFEPSESVGKTPIGEFIEENKGDGFAKYSKPKETDEDVDFATEYKDEKTEVITYSKDGKAFKVVTIVYEDSTKQKVISLSNRSINETA